jgi:CHASE3 domain sensor protein
MTKAQGRRAGGAALALSALALLVSTAISVREWRQFSREFVEAERAGEVLRQTRTLLSDVAEAESGERGFLLTGRADYLAPHDAAAARIPSTLELLSRYAAPDAATAGRADAVAPLVRDKLAGMRRTIQVRRTKGLAAALDVLRTDQDKDLMERIRSICLSIEKDQHAALESSWSGLRGSASGARWAILGGGVIAAILAAAGGWALCRAAPRN